MRIKIQQFLFGQNHSWSIVGQNIGRSLIKRGHNVEFISTDEVPKEERYKFLPDDLRKFVRDKPSGTYDCQISYTAPLNWPKYMKWGKKNRFAIWNYEYDNKKTDSKYLTLLRGFGKFYNSADLVLPSSEFTKKVFQSMKIPDEKMVVVPHGIHLSDYEGDNPWPLRTKKKRKILLNIAQPHRRKAIHLALEAFGKAFTKDDDVCLVAKVFKQNKSKGQFNVNFPDLYRSFEKKFPNHAEVEFVYQYIPNIADLYKACDINFSATHAECWHLPSLEAIACGLVNVVPRYGGQLDFCNDDNSLLIEGRVVRAPREHQYWQHNPHAVHFKVDTDDAAEKLQLSVNKYDSLREKLALHMKKTAKHFTWDNATQQILDLCVS